MGRSALFSEVGFHLGAWNRLHSAAFELVIAIVERLTNLKYFGKITNHTAATRKITVSSTRSTAE
jgi:hypothetical protein